MDFLGANGPKMKLPAAGLVFGGVLAGVIGHADMREPLSPAEQAHHGFQPIDLRRIPGTLEALLLNDWTPPYPFQDMGAIPRGFKIDGASVPGLAQAIALLTFQNLDPFGDLLPGAIPHDWLYKLTLLYDRKTADQIMRGVLQTYRSAGFAIPAWKVHAAYHTLRVGGGFTWNPRERGIRAGSMEHLRTPIIFDLDTRAPIATVGDVLSDRGLLPAGA